MGSFDVLDGNQAFTLTAWNITEKLLSLSASLHLLWLQLQVYFHCPKRGKLVAAQVQLKQHKHQECDRVIGRDVR